jgi:hypothetical protein
MTRKSQSNPYRESHEVSATLSTIFSLLSFTNLGRGGMGGG